MEQVQFTSHSLAPPVSSGGEVMGGQSGLHLTLLSLKRA